MPHVPRKRDSVVAVLCFALLIAFPSETYDGLDSLLCSHRIRKCPVTEAHVLSSFNNS